MTAEVGGKAYRIDEGHDPDNEGSSVASEPLMQFFRYAHLPEHLQARSKPFYDLACHLIYVLPDNSQRERALERLLEAKDCAVRAALMAKEVRPGFTDK